MAVHHDIDHHGRPALPRRNWFLCCLGTNPNNKQQTTNKQSNSQLAPNKTIKGARIRILPNNNNNNNNHVRQTPVSVGINPTMALYAVVLGGVCAVAAYTEKYRRNQDEIDDRLQKRYYSNMREQQAKVPQITQTIRGQDVRLDDAMNKWVWGGKASIAERPEATAPETTTGNSSTLSKQNDSSSSQEEQGDSGSREEEEEVFLEGEEKMLSKKERRRRRKERKQKEQNQNRQEEKKRLELEQQKLVVQSIAAGAAIGALAVAGSMFLSNGRK